MSDDEIEDLCRRVSTIRGEALVLALACRRVAEEDSAEQQEGEGEAIADGAQNLFDSLDGLLAFAMFKKIGKAGADDR